MVMVDVVVVASELDGGKVSKANIKRDVVT